MFGHPRSMYERAAFESVCVCVCLLRMRFDLQQL